MDFHDEATFRDVFEHAEVPLHLLGPDGTIVEANRADLELLGYQREEYVGHQVGEFHVDPALVADLLVRLARGETVRDREAWIRGRNGTPRHVLVTCNPRRGPKGELVYARCVTRPVSSRVDAGTDPDSTAAGFEILARVAPVGLFRTDAAGDCRYVNERWCDITGLTAAEARGHGWSGALHPDDRQRVFDAWYRAARDASEFVAEYRFVRAGGDVRWVTGRGVPECRDGAVIGYIGAIVDITEQKHAAAQREAALDQERAARAAADDARVDAEREISAKDDILAERDYLAAIVDTSDDAIVRKSLAGVIGSWNRGAERMFGWTANEAIGRHISLIIPPDRHAEEDEVLARIRRGETVSHFETIRVTKDGRRLRISLTVSPVKDASGRIVGASKIARDVTDRRCLEDERERLLAMEREARAEAEASNRTKDQLLAIVSHELRTPLNSIFGYARMLQTGGLDDAGRARALEVIVRSASTQSRLIDDLLDLSRIMSGRVPFTLERCAIAALLEEALEAVRPAAASKGVTIVTDFLPDMGEIVCAPDRLRQVVWNLAMNAIKFTGAGGRVVVSMRRLPTSLEIVVEDTGVGIGPEVLPHVFEPFRQEDSSTTRAHGGLGLGLALVKHIVELHGGTVRAESGGKGQGARFTVSVPLVPRESPGPTSRAALTE